MAEMHFFATVTALEQVRFRVALDADVVHDVAIAIDNVEVALFTIYSPIEVVFMDEGLVFIGIDKYFGFGLGVAGLAISNFLMVFFVIKVAVETGCLSNREMFSLNNLGVTANAFKFLAAAELAQVGVMAEINAFEFD
jgi:hypothetical protein